VLFRSGKMSEQMGNTLVDIARAKGRQEGALLTRREDLRALLTKRFGPLPEDLVQRIEGTNDLVRLQAAVEQVLDLKSLEEVPL